MSNDARIKLVFRAAADERQRFNEAIANGAVVKFSNRSGLASGQTVRCVREDWWYETAEGHSWSGCNDQQWADLMQSAGVERNPLWRKS